MHRCYTRRSAAIPKGLPKRISPTWRRRSVSLVSARPYGNHRVGEGWWNSAWPLPWGNGYAWSGGWSMCSTRWRTSSTTPRWRPCSRRSARPRSLSHKRAVGDRGAHGEKPRPLPVAFVVTLFLWRFRGPNMHYATARPRRGERPVLCETVTQPALSQEENTRWKLIGSPRLSRPRTRVRTRSVVRVGVRIRTIRYAS